MDAPGRAALHRGTGDSTGSEVPLADSSRLQQGGRWPLRDRSSNREAQGKEGGVGTAGSAGVPCSHACTAVHFSVLQLDCPLVLFFRYLIGLEGRSGCQFWRRRMNIPAYLTVTSNTAHVCPSNLPGKYTTTFYIQATSEKSFPARTPSRDCYR